MTSAQLPNSLQDERAVIGCVLTDPQQLVNIADKLRPDHFYHVKNRYVYQSIINLFNQSKPIDTLTLSQQLVKDGKLKGSYEEMIYELGDYTYAVTDFNVWGVDEYVREVMALSTRRELISAAGEIAKLAWNKEEDVREVSGVSEQLIFNVTQKNETTKARHIGDEARDLLAHSEEMNHIGYNAQAVPTGFTDVDRILDPGFSAPDLVMLAARPGMGKTAMMLSLAQNMARQGKSVAMFNLEMTGMQLTARIISSQTNLSYKAIMNGRLEDHEWKAYHEAVARLQKLPIYIENVTTLTPSMLRAKCRRMAIEHGLDVVMVDYIQLMNSDKDWGANRVQAVSEISRSLKNIAKELECPVLSASQLSRAVESRSDKRPMLSDLRDSGSLEQDSDIVMFLYRDEYYNPDTTDAPGRAELDFAKHRNGPTGMVELYWDSATASFANLQKTEVRF